MMALYLKIRTTLLLHSKLVQLKSNSFEMFRSISDSGAISSDHRYLLITK
jgi:hypothetical protein